MNASEIATALGKRTRSEQFYELQRACEPRREWIRNRIREIAQPGSSLIPLPPERHTAVLRGTAAVEELDREIERLERELPQLDVLETEIVRRMEQAEAAELRERIPRSRSALTKAVADANRALAALDAAIAVVNDHAGTLCAYERAGVAYPLTDAQLADVLLLRLAVWQRRDVQAPTPAAFQELAESHPQSWPLAFERRGTDVVIPRRPGPWLPDHDRSSYYGD